MDNGNCRSLESFIHAALINAADMYLSSDKEQDWPAFAAKIVAGQLKPIICGIQAANPTPIAHVRAYFVDYDNPNPATVGAMYASRKRK